MALRRFAGAIGAFALVTVVACPLAAQTAADKAEARALAEEGARAFDRGDYEVALERLERARDLVAVPTIGIEVARTLVALERLNDAVAAYRVVESMVLDPAMPERFAEVQRRTQDEARQERERLEAELPKAQVTESESPAVVVQPSPPAPAAPAPPPVDAPDESVSVLAIVGWTAVGLGGVAGAVSLGTYLHAASLEDDLAARCPDGICRQSASGAAIEGEVQSYDRARTASMVTLGLGAGLVALGGALLIVDVVDDEPAERASAWTMHLGLGQVGLSKRF